MKRKSAKQRFRPLVFYFINTTDGKALSRKAVREGLMRVKEAGFGGCVAFNKPPAGFSREKYLSEAWFELIGIFAEAGCELGLEIWINDGFDFPPGDAGGRIREIDPSLCQRMFARGESGKIEVREVSWGFPAFEEPESSSLFIALVYEKYKEHLGEYFGRGITGFFSDADCRRLGPVAGDALREMSAYYPSSKNFCGEFRRRYGYEPDIEGVMSGSGGRRAQDYWEMAGELYGNWLSNNYRWCRENGLKYIFHTSDTSPRLLGECRRSSVFTEGQYLKLARNSDFPGTDHELLALNGGRHFEDSFFVPEAVWGGGAENTIPEDFHDTYGDVRAKYASSAAFLHGKAGSMCELFAATNWGVDFQSLRRIASWQIMQGVTLFVFHAWHHRLGGKTKYFAPPDFSGRGALYRGLSEFNDWLSETLAMACEGEPAVDTAVLDPTKSLWRGEADSSLFFEACFRLDRMPVEYVIADEEALLSDPGRFRILVNPGLNPGMDVLRAFRGAGGIVVDCGDAGSLPDMLGKSLEFSGAGELHYSTRRKKDGSEFLLAANVCGNGPVEGRLTFGGSSCDIKLEPGEIMSFAAKGPGDRISRTPGIDIAFEPECAVEWERDNIIPLSRLEDRDGNPRLIDGGGKRLFFRWDNPETLAGAGLLAPAEFLNAGGRLFLDGEEPGEPEKTGLFSDEYFRFSSGGILEPGSHEIEFRPCGRFGNARFNNFYLAGDFSVSVGCGAERGPLWLEYYSMRLFLPEKARVSLSSRPGRLRYISWEEQGHPFYWGAASYVSELELPPGNYTAFLVLPEVASACSVSCNGKNLGTGIFSPCEFRIPAGTRHCRFRITVWNTLANMLEGYMRGSGLTARPFVRVGKELPPRRAAIEPGPGMKKTRNTAGRDARREQGGANCEK